MAQDSATIDGLSYTMGELIVGSYTEEEAANLLDDSGNPVVTSWSPYTRVETQEIEESNETTSNIDDNENEIIEESNDDEEK